MGKENKLFLPINGKPMIEWVIERVQASWVDEIVLVGSELSMERLVAFENDRIKVVDNPRYESGMTSSIQAGVEVAKGAGFMICLGDQPNIETSTYDQLMDSFRANPDSIILPFFQGKKGNPVIFPATYREAVLAHPEPEGCKGIIQQNQEQVVKTDVTDTGVLMDVDTRGDYEALR